MAIQVCSVHCSALVILSVSLLLSRWRERKKKASNGDFLSSYRVRRSEAACGCVATLGGCKVTLL